MDALIQIVSVVILILIAFFLAGLIKTIIIKLFTKINIDQKISQLLGTNIILTDVIGMI
jgi:FlaG/FlaF family flagellin (archaellin)